MCTLRLSARGVGLWMSLCEHAAEKFCEGVFQKLESRCTMGKWYSGLSVVYGSLALDVFLRSIMVLCTVKNIRYLFSSTKN